MDGMGMGTLQLGNNWEIKLEPNVRGNTGDGSEIRLSPVELGS